ncbi:hypothetical protein [Streptomyces sp. bgisy034]|uniref:hypothetical protein n=1 Tax=Streptomyces sp. bgisy034 TaxID=3413774 RepID=UPI003EB9C566
MSGNDDPKRMVGVWTWILTHRADDDEDTVNRAFLLGKLLYLGPPIILIIIGSWVSRHGVPTALVVVVALLLELLCLLLLAALPENKARDALRAAAFQPDSIKARTERLRRALADATALSQGLDTEVRVSNAALRDIEQQLAENRELLNLGEAAVQAVRHAMASETVPQVRSDLRQGNRFSCLLAILGALFGAVVTLLATMFSGALTLH